MLEMFSHVYGAEIFANFHFPDTTSRRIYRQPSWGVAANFFDLEKSINGKVFTSQIHFEIGVFKKRPQLARLRFATGFGYLTKKFDVFENRKNRAIGSHINGLMQVNLTFHKQIKKINAFLGIGLTHYSNGNWQQPNLGINMPAITAGFSYRPFQYVSLGASNSRFLKGFTDRLQWQISARAGRRNPNFDENKVFVIGALGAILSYPHPRLGNFRVGADYFYDKTYRYIKFQPLQPGGFDKTSELAAVFGHEYKINRIGFIADLGFYLYRPDKTKRGFYEAIGLKYYVHDNFSLMLRLKAHLATADYFEWGVVYNLFSRRTVKPGFTNGWKWVLGGFKMK